MSGRLNCLATIAGDRRNAGVNRLALFGEELRRDLRACGSEQMLALHFLVQPSLLVVGDARDVSEGRRSRAVQDCEVLGLTVGSSEGEDEECFYNSGGSTFGKSSSSRGRINSASGGGILTIVPTTIMSRSSSFNCSPSSSDYKNNTGIKSFIKRTMSFMGNSTTGQQEQQQNSSSILQMNRRKGDEEMRWLDSINLRRLFGSSFKSVNYNRKRSVVTGGVWNDLWSDENRVYNNTIGRIR